MREESVNTACPASYETWEAGVSELIRADVLWRVEAYRLALFLGDLSWHDATKLAGDRRTLSTSDQLYRAAGAVNSNIAEGYSRSSAKDRARFYEYALGSLRESRNWYHLGRHVLGEIASGHRLELTTRIIRLTLAMVQNEHRTTGRRLGGSIA